MQLDKEQVDSVVRGEPVRLMVAGRHCVLLPWETWRNGIDRSSEVAVGELVAETMADYDAADPLLEGYRDLAGVTWSFALFP